MIPVARSYSDVHPRYGPLCGSFQQSEALNIEAKEEEPSLRTPKQDPQVT